MAKLDTRTPSVLRQIKASLSTGDEAEHALLNRLAQGEREIARGEGFDLDHVLNEADSLLRRPHE